nr:PGR5-like protein 1A, chloroplastic [Tanacetum cinerariifolium]
DLSSTESGTWQAIESQKPFIILWSYCNFRRRLNQLKVKSRQLQKTNLITEYIDLALLVRLGNESYFGRIAKYDSESHHHYVISLSSVCDYLDVNEMILLTANLDDCHDIETGDIIWDKLTGLQDLTVDYLKMFFINAPAAVVAVGLFFFLDDITGFEITYLLEMAVSMSDLGSQTDTYADMKGYYQPSARELIRINGTTKAHV